LPTVREALTLAEQAMQAGDHVGAARTYQQILEVVPNHPNALHGLGIIYLQAERFADAEGALRRAVAEAPNDASLHNNLNLALRGLGRLDEALACCRRALELAPQMPELHNNLAILLKETGALDEAVASFQQAIQLKPDYAEVHYNLAESLLKLCRLDEAERCYRRALELKPGDWETLSNLGNLLQLEGRFSEAMACFERGLAVQGQSPDLHRSRGRLRLLLGELAEGWSDYEWRLQIRNVDMPRHPQPIWRGESLSEKTILLCAEQGLGDVIQFIRYARLVKERGAARVLVECPPQLQALLGTAGGIDRLIASGRGERFDFYIPLLSLPAVFNTTLDTIPCEPSYLSADSARVAHWRGRLARVAGFKVGIAWQGNPNLFEDNYRSVALEEFKPLADTPGVTLVSLQKGHGAEQLGPWADRWGVVEVGSRLDDLADTAAVMMNLDLVVAIDTAVAHLAGALGVPVWVPLPLAPNWRWLLERTDSPWYPSMRLFRQSRFAEWDEVFEEMADRLRSLSAQAGVE
jgi:Flp pilus assembly protein TadD